MEKKLRMTPDQVVEQAVKDDRLGAQNTPTTSRFSGRMPAAPRSTSLVRIFEAVIDAGAKTINVPDTVGYNVPEQFAATVRS